MLNFNDVGVTSTNTSNLIPNNTVAKVRLNLVAGGYNDPDLELTCGSATQSASGAVYLKTNYEILEGEYKGRVIWGLIGIYSPKGDIFGEIGRSTIRNILESARGIVSHDKSPTAEKRRILNSYKELNCLEFPALISIKKDQNGEDQNVMKRAISSDDSRYQIIMGIELPIQKPKNEPLIDDELPF